MAEEKKDNQEKQPRHKVFFDAEFTGLHQLTTLVSIAFVAENGQEFYAELSDYDPMQIDDFLQENVMSKRILGDYNFQRDYDPDAKTVFVKGNTELIKEALTAWFHQFSDRGIELWGDVYAYDYILLVSIFGNAFDIPRLMHYIPMDLATLLRVYVQDPDVDREEFAYGAEKGKQIAQDKHNALTDARTQLAVYNKLLEMSSTKGQEEEKEAPSEEKQAETTINGATNEELDVNTGAESGNNTLGTKFDETIEEQEQVQEPAEIINKELDEAQGETPVLTQEPNYTESNPTENEELAEKGKRIDETKKKLEENNNPVQVTPSVDGMKNVVTNTDSSQEEFDPHADFVEPTQEDIDGAEEWHPPM